MDDFRKWLNYTVEKEHLCYRAIGDLDDYATVAVAIVRISIRATELKQLNLDIIFLNGAY
jgi:hypothetical protein